MIDRLRGKENLIKLVLLLTTAIGLYLIVAWASYSPLDNAWSVASSATHHVLNKTGALGAWIIDILFSAFGKAAFIFPFGLTFTAVYVLVLRLADELNWREMIAWFISFLLLIIGLSGLANVILSNSAYYLSGGVVGGLLNDFVSDSLGQFGVLFISMLLTAVGFYFCSGQIVIGLFNRLYHWIIGTPKDQLVPLSKKTARHNDVMPETIELENSEELEESQLTDVSVFSRPNITGLKNTEQSVSVVTTETVTAATQETISDNSMYSIHSETHLPKVSVPESISHPVFSSTNENMMHEIPSVQEERVMPTIRLNPQTSVNSSPASKEEGNVIAGYQPNGVQNEGQPKFVGNMMPQVQLEPIQEGHKPVQEELAFEPKTQSSPYPKGYGDSLIHPLLQRRKTVEKPTTPFPTIDLLTATPATTQQITKQEILETSDRIERALASFGVKASVEDVLVGPVVTRYEILPADGVRVSKIANLGSDLARALIFKAIRITDVVPGKPYMGIETPNRHRETVWLRDVLDSNEFRHSQATLPMALGKDISGQPVVVDMAKMPHLLVAGQTGGGKSVGVNTMILSLLFKLTPEQVRFIMIDPKVVELSIYNDIPHLLTPVVTDMKKAENALRWAVEEMERRYLLVSSLSVRNIEGYNDKIEKAAEMNLPIPNPLWRPRDSMDELAPPLEKMSYIVLIVDEFADLMMSAGKQVEDHIMRIAQKARAVGIHLILATQRPSTDVITGVIKANIPSRIAFTVASQIDSRTILDKGGAESLLGRGDMLYSGAGSPEIIRIHGAFMTDDDVQRVADNWRARGKPSYIENITASVDDDNESGERGTSGDLDPLFDEVTQFMIDSGTTSISGIQRRFSIGFNRAARIIDQLEEQGIVSAADNRGKRELLAR
ncbi:DNA translocase FtsK [Glaesserella sp.]|uniref:DNA translocase FtsK n=1 Tax=Glaesserella sp. TaxID=2094731 RepID=UPI00359F68C0